MGLKRGEKRTWVAGNPPLQGKRTAQVVLTEELHQFLKQHYPSVSAGLRTLAEKEMERRKKQEARKQERQRARAAGEQG